MTDTSEQPIERDPKPAETDAKDRLLDRIQRDAMVTRRDFLRLMATVSGGMCVGTGAIAAGVFPRHGEGGGEPRLISRTLPEGEALAFNYPTPDDPAIAVRLESGELVGYSSVCTHLACGVIWRKDDGELFCPCHDGKFDPKTGSPTGGPPKRPLPAIALEERADGIYAVGTKKNSGHA
jgi:nitrite reductase/ring-hydroxylating ferredoxin subunit